MDNAAERIVRRFGLMPHPEGGFFREVYRASAPVADPALPTEGAPRRCAGTFIYFLLADGQFSAFHRVRSADEIWHLYAGGPLELHVIDGEDRYTRHALTTDVELGEPAAVVAAGCWQAARLAPGSGWAFCGCTVSPGFEFSDFEMPPADLLLDLHPQHESIIRALTRR